MSAYSPIPEQSHSLFRSFVRERHIANHQTASKYMKVMASLGIVRGLIAFSEPFPAAVQWRIFLYMLGSGLWSIFIASNLYRVCRKFEWHTLESYFPFFCIMNTGVAMLYLLYILYGYEDITMTSYAVCMLMMLMGMYCSVSTIEACIAYAIYELGVIILLTIINSHDRAVHVSKELVIILLCIICQKKMEEEHFANYKLRKSLEARDKLFHCFMEASKDAVIIINVDTQQVVFENTSAVSLIGDRRNVGFSGIMPFFYRLVSGNVRLIEHIDELIKSNAEQWYEESSEKLYHRGESLASSGEPDSVPGAGEEGKAYLVKTMKIHVDNGMRGLGVIMKDVTRIKLLEEARELENYKQSLLCTFSHEMRTPLIGVCGVLRIIRSQAASKQTRDLVATAMSSAKLFTFYVNGILDYFLYLSGKLEARMEMCSLPELLQRAQKLVAAQVWSKVDVSVQVDRDAPRMYRTDSSRFTQIITKLLNNACKYTFSGFIVLSARVMPGSLLVSVQDTGVGIVEEKVMELMQLFTGTTTRGRLKSAPAARSLKGSKLAGLGLEICGILTRLIGGTLTVESRVNAGTVFTLHLPLGREELGDYTELLSDEGAGQIPTERESHNPVVAQVPRSATLKKERAAVLIVDDNTTNRCVLKAMIQSEGLEAVEAANGAEAVRCVERNWKRIGLVLMDIEMPIMDGIEATEILKIKFRSIPVLAVTAYSSELDEKKCLESGMREVIQKPVGKKQLRSVLAKYSL